MPELNASADLAVAFTTAWASGDMDAVRHLVTRDIHFESPMVELSGVEPYLSAVGAFAALVTSVEVISVVGTQDRAMIMYDMTTAPFGTLRAAEHFVFENGKVSSDQLVFDTYAVRKAQEAGPSSD